MSIHKMSRTVHLLWIFNNDVDFFKQAFHGELLVALLNKGKKYDAYFREIADAFNAKRNIIPGPEFHKGLTVPRLKIIMALVAQMMNVEFVNPNLIRNLNILVHEELKTTPERFQEKFVKLLVPGFWLLGVVIEDSLSEDSTINYGNPFKFLPGDLGFWWAGVVIMDWVKYEHIKKPEGLKKSYSTCKDFYNDCCLKRKYRYAQISAMSHLDRIPQQFLDAQDEENFLVTIDKIGPDVKGREIKLAAFFNSLKM